MRLHLAAAVFLLALFAAACGGGGGSSPVVPTRALPAPPSQQIAARSMVLKIPAQQPGTAGQKRPAYVSPATKSALVIVTPITVPSSTPLASQLFPVATPSPCSQNPDGSKNCTFQVNVPYGNDAIAVETFNVANPGPNDVPLATFNSTLTVSPGSSPAPVSFTLSGVVSSVSLSIASPEPSISPQTQIVLAGAPSSPAPIAITPYDQSGNPILTDDFSTPISLSVSAPSSGVELQIVNSQCSPAASSSAAATISITCAKDLANVRYFYNGGLAHDSAHNIVDAVVIAASPNPAGAATSTIGVRLRSNVLSYPMAVPSSPPAEALNAVDASNNVTYLLSSYDSTIIGRFSASAPNPIVGATLPYQASGLAVSNGGSIWIGKSYDPGSLSNLYALDCFSAISTMPVETVNLTSAANGNKVTPSRLVRDRLGNIWFIGYDTTYAPFAGYIPASEADCTAPTAVAAAISLNTTDSPSDIAAMPAGVLILTEYNLFTATTSTTGSIQSTPLPSPYYAYHLNTDGTGNAIVSLSGGATPAIGFLANGASSFTVLPLPQQADAVTPALYPTDAAATRFGWADDYNGWLAIGDRSLPTTAQMLPMPTTSNCIGSFFDVNGDLWGECAGLDGSISLNRVLRTATWNLIAPGFVVPGNVALGVLERADSSPFTLTGNSDPSDVRALVDSTWSAFTHNIPLTVSAPGSGTFTATVTDAHGRSISAVVPLASPTPCNLCAARPARVPHGKRHPSRTRPG